MSNNIDNELRLLRFNIEDLRAHDLAMYSLSQSTLTTPEVIAKEYKKWFEGYKKLIN